MLEKTFKSKGPRLEAQVESLNLLNSTVQESRKQICFLAPVKTAQIGSQTVQLKL